MASAARGALRKFTFDLDPRAVGEGTAPLDPSKKHVYFAIPTETAGTEDQLDALEELEKLDFAGHIVDLVSHLFNDAEKLVKQKIVTMLAITGSDRVPMPLLTTRDRSGLR